MFAVLGGREYAGRPVRENGTVLVRSGAVVNPDPSRFTWNERVGEWHARLPATELDRLYQANTYATYRGHRVNITAVDDTGSATVYFADRDGSWAEENGFAQVDKYVWLRQVPVWELREVYECQDDLLFPVAGQRPRAGLFATVGGREYRAEALPDRGVVTLVSDAAANPDPELFEADPGGRWRAEVLVEQCERLDEVTTHGLYRGHECQVVAIEPDGATGLYYLGPDKSRAARDGFVQTEPGVWARTVDVFDVARLWERHTDLLFAATYGTA